MLWPAVEANQGLISIVALLLALALALWEQRQASLQRLRERSDEIQDAVTLIDELESFLTAEEGNIDVYEWEQGEELVRTLAMVLRTLAEAHARTPLVALALIRAAQIADEIAAIEWHADPLEASDALEDALEKLGQVKGDIEAARDLARRRAVTRKAERDKSDRALKRLLRSRKMQAGE